LNGKITRPGYDQQNYLKLIVDLLREGIVGRHEGSFNQLTIQHLQQVERLFLEPSITAFAVAAPATSSFALGTHIDVGITLNAYGPQILKTGTEIVFEEPQNIHKTHFRGREQNSSTLFKAWHGSCLSQYNLSTAAR
jgi:hypothetical protein